MDGTIKVKIKELERFMLDVLVKMGIPAEDARICTDVLLASDLRGIDSHGIGRLKMYVDRIRAGILNPITKWEVIKETPTTVLIDGHHGMGHVIAHQAMNMAIDKAQKLGVGIATVRNSSHFGIAAYYPLMAVAAGMVGLSFTNARPSIAPTYGVDPMLGTNPICMAAPTDNGSPFVLDGATSITQRGKIELYQRAEKDTPAGMVINDQGETLTDTDHILQALVQGVAALLPLGGAGEILGGHKGYGLATMVEILCASFGSGSHGKDLTGRQGDKQVPHKLGHMFIAINIENFVTIDEFKKTTGQICRNLANSHKAPGQDRIFYAGEKEYEAEQQRRRDGVPINKNLQKTMKQLISELDLGAYDFGF